MPAVPIAIVLGVVLGGFLSGHRGLVVLLPVLVFLAIRRLAGDRQRPDAGRDGLRPVSLERLCDGEAGSEA